MNLYFLKRVLTTNLIFLISLSVFSQDDKPPQENPDYGPDPESRIQCANDLSTMTEFMKIDLYDYALPAWRRVFESCPASSKNIYISGAKIFSKKIEEASDPGLKQSYYDTLMMIYDKRIEHFGEEAYVEGRRGVDIIMFNEKDFESAYKAFARSMELSGKETDLNVITGLMQTGAVMQKFDKISAEIFLTKYLQARNILEEKKNMGEHPGKLKRVQSMMDKTVTEAGINDCQTIEGIFSAKFTKDGYEPELLEVAKELLSSTGCDNTEFAATINEKMLEISPDPSLAYEVARYNIRNDNFEKAAEYIKKAIENEEDNSKKAVYQYQLAVILSGKLEKYSEARDVALEAAENDNKYGEPYLLIATNYLAGFKTCNPEAFERAAIYWLAVDYVKKAMQSDPTLADKAAELISQYKQNFPSVEDVFFRSMKVGDSYSFGCWINETTTVKEK